MPLEAPRFVHRKNLGRPPVLRSRPLEFLPPLSHKKRAPGCPWARRAVRLRAVGFPPRAWGVVPPVSAKLPKRAVPSPRAGAAWVRQFFDQPTQRSLPTRRNGLIRRLCAPVSQLPPHVRNPSQVFAGAASGPPGKAWRSIRGECRLVA